MVGCPYDDVTGATNSGAAYVFDVTTGALLLTLTKTPRVASDFFGGSVSISGSSVVVGASGVDVFGAENAGAAYVFGPSLRLTKTVNPTAARPGETTCW